jgi:uncharacterized protein involved in outer membrane biogenesis
MGKLVKIILGVVVVLLIVAGILITFVISNLDQIVERVIETEGSKVAGVPVSVASVQISLTEGQGAISGLRVGNPSGFEADHAIVVERAALTLDLESIGADVVVLKSVLVDGATLNYEQQGKGSNLQTILDNVEAYGGEGETTDDSETKLIIDKFNFLNAQANVSIAALKQTRSVEIPDIRLKGIGRESSGVTASEAGKQILKPIMQKSITAAAGVSLDEVKEMAQEEAMEAVDRAKEKAKDRLGGFLGGKKD